MTNLELQKMANEVRKGIVTVLKQVIRADLYLQQICSHTFTLKK